MGLVASRKGLGNVGSHPDNGIRVAPDTRPLGRGENDLMNERTPLIVGGALILGLLAVALVFGSGRTVAEQPPNSPEAVVQAYLEALIAEDDDAASALTADDSEDPCLGDRNLTLGNIRVALGRVEIDGATARVEVATTDVDEGALGGARYDSTFVLRLVDDSWLIDAADWPYGCGDLRPIEEES